MSYQAELFVDIRAVLGESPVWDAQRGMFYWVDIMGPTVYARSFADGSVKTLDLSAHGSSIGCVAPCDSGKLIMGLDRKIAMIGLDEDTPQILAECDPDLEGHRFNDGKCDPFGRFVLGMMGNGTNDWDSPVYSYTAGQAPKLIHENVLISNGLGWNPDYTVMYYADSGSRDVFAFDYDAATGALSNQRVVFTLPDGALTADGMTTDREGMIWLAWWDGYCVTRWNPNTGEMIDKVEVPAPRVTSCCFGGDEMKTLFITTARTGLSEETLATYPHSGAVFKVETDVEGMPSFAFKS